MSSLAYVRDVTKVVILIDYHEIFGLNVVRNHSWAYLDTEKDIATMRKCTGDEKNGRIEWCVAVEMCATSQTNRKKYEQSFSSQPNNALGIEIHSFCRLSPQIFYTTERKYDISWVSIY